MKNLLLKTITFVTLVNIVSPSWAQDIIVTNQAKKIEAKILEVSKSEIRYKEMDNMEGPTFILGVEDINSIIYANGKVVLYNTTHSESTNDDVDAEKRANAAALMDIFFNNNQTGERDDAEASEINNRSNSGNSWSLMGREIVSLPRPAPDFNQEGKVIVQISVNAKGYVVSATCAKGTTISDQHTIQLALDAARKARFSKSENKLQTGTITYTFKLN